MGESTESWHVEAPRDGEVVVSAVKLTVTEKEINDDREGIVDHLHAAYLSLVEAMAPYQKEWDADWQKALEDATLAGLKAGLTEWGGDFADYFKKETWTDLGGKIEKAAGSAYDTASDYAAELNKKITTQVNSAVATTEKLLEHPEETLANWTWWSSVIEEAVSKPLKDLEDRAMKTVTEVTETAKKVQKMYQHRDAILNFPVLLVEGDPKPIQNFVDTVLKDIDPELAKAIREDPKFYVVLEVLADHESALAYLSYASLAFEAIPPNFYAYLAGKCGAYVLVELVLLIITALLSAGAAAAARIASWAARIAMSSAKVAKAVKLVKSVVTKAQELERAVENFQRVIEDFLDVSKRFHQLGEKLLKARKRGLKLEGRTKSTIEARRKIIKREHKCRYCGSTAHTTPHGRLGTVKYE